MLPVGHLTWKSACLEDWDEKNGVFGVELGQHIDFSVTIGKEVPAVVWFLCAADLLTP